MPILKAGVVTFALPQNFNDGTAGGEVLEMNLVMNFVRESGDHGMFVSDVTRNFA